MVSSPDNTPANPPQNDAGASSVPATARSGETKKLSDLAGQAQAGDAQQAPADPLIGQVIDGRYVIQRRIDRGGMATVYQALDQRLDRIVALKVMHPHLAEQGDFLARFRREARAAAKLTHSGIVAVYDQGGTSELSYLAMEYIHGPNLRTHLRQRGSLTVSQALIITEHILAALSAAHRVGLVHRDMKPENVLLPREGGVKVADFGLARAVTEATGATTGSIFGTVAYLAPELITNSFADARADIYAVGVMLYELLVGRQPLQAETPVAVAYQHVNAGIPAPSEVVDWIPAEVDQLVASFTARAVDQRPADAAAALEMVRAVRNELPADVLSRRATVVAPANGAASPGEVNAGRSGAITVHISSPSPAVIAANTGKVKKKRGRSLLVSLLLVVLLAAGGVLGWNWYVKVGPGSFSVVPRVANLPVADAKSALEFEGFEVKVTETFDDDVTAQHVISSTPAAGQRIKRGTTISVVVSLGIEQVAVPKVTGLTKDGALAALQQGRLEAGNVAEEFSESVDAGLVISCSPNVGTKVNHSTKVDLVVSKGPEPVPVPAVTGAAQEAAVEALTTARLQAEVTEEFSSEVAAGVVISQSVEAGSRVVPGSSVTLVVSKGPQMVSVPDLTGKQYEEAAAVLSNLGLVPARENVLGGFFGTVRSSNPGAGTEIPIGSTVTLTVV
ncbi:MAG: Stk1 family PASTA domain-containing Ser/Thr kinase [Buchananella hordeovulneris]|nr:Stk1 family PASTA domain-containing Ser/Thr kinase [Buchananella hordeovulneris]